MICIVPEGEAEIMREGGGSHSSDFGLPESIVSAFMDFILTGAAKSLRILGNNNHTMLVQTHHEIETHEVTQHRMSSLWESWKNDITINTMNAVPIKKFEERWNSEFKNSDESWTDLSEVICSREWLEKIEIVTLNIEAPERLDYTTDENGLMIVVIGGLSLGRGLTLEGLTVSYFARTSNNYDTLLQMGRWFGFRKGYEDLMRVHLTGERYACFSHLAEVEKEIRDDIARYEELGLSPEELAVRIRTHHTMKVTSYLKMRDVRLIQKGWSASSIQTINFDFGRTQELIQNMRFTQDFLWSLGEDFSKVKGSHLWRGIDFPKIKLFLNQFNFGKNSHIFDVPEIEKYICRVNSRGEAKSWSVAIVGKDKGKGTSFGPVKLSPISRTRITGTDSIGTLVNPPDWIMDLPGKFIDYTNDAGNYDKNKMILKRKGAEASPLLLIYIIAKDSKPEKENSRVRLFQDEEEPVPVVGLAIAFPESATEVSGRTYLSNRGIERYE